MIRATAAAATQRPTALRAPARPAAAPVPLALALLLLVAFALVSIVAGGRPAVAAEPARQGLQVRASGVGFDGESGSEGLIYEMRPAGSGSGTTTFTRSLSRSEQRDGWAAFLGAADQYPGGYCVVRVAVSGAGEWHESGGNAVCTGTVTPTPDPTPTPTPTPTTAPPAPEPAKPTTPKPSTDTATPAQPESAAPPRTPVPVPAPEAERKAHAEETPTPTPTPSASPSASPSTSPSPKPSGTPSASAPGTSPESALIQIMGQQPPIPPYSAAAEEGDLFSPLGWVAVLGGGALLTLGGAMVLWRRLT